MNEPIIPKEIEDALAFCDALPEGPWDACKPDMVYTAGPANWCRVAPLRGPRGGLVGSVVALADGVPETALAASEARAAQLVELLVLSRTLLPRALGELAWLQAVFADRISDSEALHAAYLRGLRDGRAGK